MAWVRACIMRCRRGAATPERAKMRFFPSDSQLILCTDGIKLCQLEWRGAVKLDGEISRRRTRRILTRDYTCEKFCSAAHRQIFRSRLFERLPNRPAAWPCTAICTYYQLSFPSSAGESASLAFSIMSRARFQSAALPPTHPPPGAHATSARRTRSFPHTLLARW